MATKQQHHHHTHNQHMDSASRFKYESLRAIKRRKLLAKWGFRALVAIAILAVAALIAVYMVD